jgi:hypothetical protein
MFGDDWIDALTPREKWLVDNYVEGRRRDGLVNTPSVMAGCSWSIVPLDPALRGEVERARDRRDWRKDQWEQAFHWLEEQDFDLDVVDVEENVLEAALLRLRKHGESSGKAVGTKDAPIQVTHDELTVFYREYFAASGAAKNREEMDAAAESHFGRHIPVKVRVAARRAAGVRGKVGRRPGKSGR